MADVESGTLLSIIGRKIERLRENLQAFSEMRRSLGLLNVEQRLLCLEYYLEEISSRHQSDDLLLGTISERLEGLRAEQLRVSELEQILLDGNTLNDGERDDLSLKSEIVHRVSVYKTVLLEFYTGSLHSNPLMPLSSAVLANLTTCEELLGFWSNLNGHDTNPVDQRFLVVSNGVDLHYLDLNHSRDQSFSNARDVPLLPVFASVKPREVNRPLHPTPMSVCLLLYRLEAMEHGRNLLPPGLVMEGCSFLSMDDSKSTLSLCETEKIRFPVVENIAGLLHLIGSVRPSMDENVEETRDWILSHDVLSGNLFTKVRTLEVDDDVQITSHLVVGRRIFAIVKETYRYDKRFLVFNATGIDPFSGSESLRWNWVEHEQYAIPNLEDVWDILDFGPGRCVMQYSDGSPSDSVYVIMALQRNRLDLWGVRMVAYLVTSTGKIVCFQPILDFFKCAVWPCEMVHGTIIESEKRSKTICSVLMGSAWDDDSSNKNYVFINTFTVEKLVDAAAEVHAIWEGEDWPVQMNFVRVGVKARYIYNADPWVNAGGFSRPWERLQACFL